MQKASWCRSGGTLQNLTILRFCGRAAGRARRLAEGIVVPLWRHLAESHDSALLRAGGGAIFCGSQAALDSLAALAGEPASLSFQTDLTNYGRGL